MSGSKHARTQRQTQARDLSGISRAMNDVLFKKRVQGASKKNKIFLELRYVFQHLQEVGNCPSVARVRLEGPYASYGQFLLVFKMAQLSRSRQTLITQVCRNGREVKRFLNYI